MKTMSTEFIEAFKAALQSLLPLGEPSLSEIIRMCVDDTTEWVEKLPTSTSELNIRSYFIQLLSKKIALGETLQNDQVLSVLLDDIGLPKVGDAVEIQGKPWRVIWRRLGNDFGIEFGLANESGEFKSHMFFD
jgi:hypothetical protein